MKRTFTRYGVQSIAALFFLVCGMLLSNRATAQAPVQNTTIAANQSAVLQGHSVSKEQHNWVTENDALAILENAIATSADQLSLLLPVSPQYKNLMFHITYYKLILGLLEEGKTTQQAVQLALDQMNAAGYAIDAGGNFNKNDLLNLYTEAVDMLAF